MEAGTPITFDPTELQIRDLDKMLGEDSLSAADIAKRPEAVQLILRQQAVQLAEIRSLKSESSDLRLTINALRDERENLRINLAALRERHSASVMEVPVSIASGFAINMLTSNFGDPVGWLLLLMSLSLLGLLRKTQIGAMFSRKESRTEE